MPSPRDMSRRPSRDPDALVFWLTTALCALFFLFVPGAPGGIIAHL